MQFQDPEIVNLGTEPISSDSASGISVRYDPDFEQLSGEVAKAESLTAGAIDWPNVTRLGLVLLKEKSKDLRIAAYLALGLLKTKGAAGLFSGLVLYRDLLVNFWETAFPEKSRMRGRIGAVEWLFAQLTSSLLRDSIQAPDELLLELERAAVELVSTVNDCLANDAPPSSEMLQIFHALADGARSRRAAVEAAEKQKEAAAASEAAAPEPATSTDTDKVLEQCRSQVLRIANLLHEADPSDPLSYRLSRSVTWGWVVSPPLQENGTTHMPPLDPSVLEQYGRLLQNRNWLALVQETESGHSDRFFAFDLQRYCVRALSELGPQFLAAREALVTELQGLLRRIPVLLDLKFVDGTPMFGAETKAWVEEEVLTPQASSTPVDGKASKPGPNEPQARIAAAVKEARRLAETGDFQQALSLFKGGIAQSSQSRIRFLWRLQLAKLCMDLGKPQLALPHLTLLDEQVSRFSLEEWEPELSIEVVQQLFHCRQKLAGNGAGDVSDARHELQELYQRLCRLDINAALTVEF